MKNYAFLFWGFTVVWIGLAGYLAWLLTRLGRVDRRLLRMERRLRPDADATSQTSERS